MQKKSIEKELNKNGWAIIALHILLWLIVFLIPYIFSANMEGGHHKEDNLRQPILYLNTGLNFFWIVLFYVNVTFLLPRLIYRRKIMFYIFALLAGLSVMVVIDGILFHIFMYDRVFSIYNSLKHNFVPFAFTLAVSAAYKAISDKTKADILIREKQSENLKTELSFLRSQISPHFLFNVLNNIVAMVRLKSNELEPTVLKLASIMQYMLYETDEEKVVLQNEVEYLRNYIDLQKQRFGPELLLSMNFDLKEEWHVIEPMLLIPFVENAFKHGNSLLHDSQIMIGLQVENSQLDLLVRNRYEETVALKDKTSGIGLQNVKRRLELLYSGRHTLTTGKSDGWFTIHLHITLK